MSYYDGFDDYGTRAEPDATTWRASGTLFLDGVECPGETEMVHQSEYHHVSGTVKKWVDWSGECGNGHPVSSRAVDGGNDFRSGSVLKQEVPCDGSCPNPVSWDADGNVDYVHKVSRYVCAACLAGGSVVEVSPGWRAESFNRSYPSSRVTTFKARTLLLPSTGTDSTSFVFVLADEMQGRPAWLQGTVKADRDVSWFKGSRLPEVTWVSHDELRVYSRDAVKGGAPTRPMVFDEVKS